MFITTQSAYVTWRKVKPPQATLNTQVRSLKAETHWFSKKTSNAQLFNYEISACSTIAALQQSPCRKWYLEADSSPYLSSLPPAENKTDPLISTRQKSRLSYSSQAHCVPQNTWVTKNRVRDSSLISKYQNINITHKISTLNTWLHHSRHFSSPSILSGANSCDYILIKSIQLFFYSSLYSV